MISASARHRVAAVLALVLALIAPETAAQAQSDQASLDAAYMYQTPFNVVGSGTVVTVAVAYRNAGQSAWVRGTGTEVALAVCAIDKVTCGVPSPYAAWAVDWASPTIYAKQPADWVLPGELAVFVYSIRAPDDIAPGTRIRLHGELVLASTGRAVHPSGYYQDAVAPYAVRLSAETTALAPGQSAQFWARVVDRPGRHLVGAPTTWSVVGPGDIGADGVLVLPPDAAGITTVVARSGDVASQVRVQILAPPPASIELSPIAVSLAAGGATRFMATVLDATGSAVATRPVTWTVSGVGSITDDGTFSAGGTLGSAVVTAGLGAITASARVTVLPRPTLSTPTAPTVTPLPSAAPTASPTSVPSSAPPAGAAPSPSPTAVLTSSPSPSPSPFPMPSPAPTPTPTPAPTAAPVPSSTPTSPAPSPTSPAPSPTAQPSPPPVTTASPSPVPSPSPSPSPTPSAISLPTTSPTPSPTVGEVILTPLIVVLGPGETETFTALALDLLGLQIVNAPVEWSATGAGSIDATGAFRASDDPAGGTATVRAASGGVTGTAQVVVEPRTVARIEIVPAVATISTGDVVVFTAKLFDQDGTRLLHVSTHWSVAGPGTIDATGRYTASDDAGGGVATVTATSGGVTASAVVSIEPDVRENPDLLPGL